MLAFFVSILKKVSGIVFSSNRQGVRNKPEKGVSPDLFTLSCFELSDSCDNA